MIHIAAGPVPASLNGPTSAGGRERAEAIRFFRPRANRSSSYDFTAYKGTDVAAGLKSVFGSKCAYCESSYAETAPPDIEHYRPKGGVEVNGRLNKPGYYWLAADWTNLLPSCIDCNRKRTHDFPEAGPELRGKANRFPIANPADRATAPGQESREKRLLLHPCLDKPEEHLEFISEGVIRARQQAGVDSEMGKVSIEIYGLDRTALTQARGRVLRLMEGVMQRIRDAQAQLTPGIPAIFEQYLERSIRADVAVLKGFAEPGEPYAGMARQAIKRFLTEIGIPDQ
jgi:uncharacterized protein (TIGR02646 family)